MGNLLENVDPINILIARYNLFQTREIQEHIWLPIHGNIDTGSVLREK